jgi:small subunit ribosomal protein S4
MIRKKNRYSRPKKPFESVRIKEENELRKKYALKNKKEIWKTIAKVSYYRKRAMSLARAPYEEQLTLFNKLKELGIKAEVISDVLGLKVEDLLERRLPTIVAKLKIANTPKQARQMVAHKRIQVNDKVVNIPGYLVSVNEEKNIKLKQKIKSAKPTEKENSAENKAEIIGENTDE